MQVIDGIFYIIVLIMSVVIHEFAHGYVAYLLGDNTAKMSGRLTLNPIKHLDLFGSVILPLLLVISKAGFLIGWAKPVPYNPNNLRNQKWGAVWVALAGIGANLALVIIFSIIIRLAPLVGITAEPFYNITSIIVLLNLVLFFFNIIPIPPLDGSKVLFAFLPPRFNGVQMFLEKYGIFVLLFFIIFIWNKVSPVIFFLFSFSTGL
ncbi:MAG: site-2 protease family protein [Patescibacteria group bacterium]|nr:site-2 protease family protein [Patescibacteria group bacterium]